VTAAQGDARTSRVTVRLAVMLSLAMAVAAMASTLALLSLQRPFLSSQAWLDPGFYQVLFAAAIATGLLSALVGLGLGVVLSRRIWALIHRADAAGVAGRASAESTSTELSALDAAVGRLTLSMDRFITDSDILARLPAAMLMIDSGGHLLSFNTTSERLLDLDLGRFAKAPLLGETGALPLGRGNGALATMLADADTRGLAQAEDVTIVTAAGRRLLLDVTIQRRAVARHGVGSVLLLRDTSEKRRIREQIRKADQLALLGGMAARVAHEVRTPLAAMRGLVELLEAELPGAGRSQRYIARMIDALDRQDQLVHRLLTLTHPEPETPQPVPVRPLLRDLIMGWPGPHPMLTIEGSIPDLHGDPVLLSEVFTNLVQNAVEASGSERVEVLVRGDANRVRVTVSNYDVGIPFELQERVFQPFFTTKPRGTGLGLAIARQVVEAHRGTIRVESDGRTVTHFVVDLPAARPAEVLVHA
jgi:signal transduction histidine kinase